MTYLAKVGSFNLDTAKTAGQTQAITGLGFTPKVVIAWWSGTNATGDNVAGGNISYGFGVMKSATERYCFDCTASDGAAAQAARRQTRDDSFIWIYNSGFTVDGAADFSSFDADGFTIVMDDQFARAYRISYLALAGTDITNVKVGTFTMPGATGNFNVTGVGFQPSALIVGTTTSTAVSTSSTLSYPSIGFATGSANQGVVGGVSGNGGLTMVAGGYGYNGEIVVRLGDATTLSNRIAFVSFGADGFTLNQIEGTTAGICIYVALLGGSYSVGDINTKTDGSDIAETVGFTPSALLFASANRALSTQDTATSHSRISIGAATSASNRAAQAMSDEHGLPDAETAYANYDTAVYANILDDAIIGLMDIKSIDASGFTAVMDDTDPAGCWVTYLAMGATVIASSRVSSLSLLGVG